MALGLARASLAEGIVAVVLVLVEVGAVVAVVAVVLLVLSLSLFSLTLRLGGLQLRPDEREGELVESVEWLTRPGSQDKRLLPALASEDVEVNLLLPAYEALVTVLGLALAE